MNSGAQGSSANAASALLRLADQRYRALVRSLPHSAILLCDHDLRFVLVDGPEVEATGFSKERLEGRTIHEALPKPFAELVESNIRRVLAGETFSAELPFEDRFYEYNYVPIRDDNGAVLYGMILALNVSERRRAEARQRKSDERFERIFRSSPEALIVVRKGDGMVRELNEGFAELFGYSRDEVIGRTTLSLGLWPDPEDRQRIVRELNQCGEIESLEVAVRSKHGVLMHGTISGRPFEWEGEECMLGVFRDTSAQHAARQELALSEDRFRSLSEATFEGIAIADAGILVDCNDQLTTMYRSTREALIGIEIWKLVAPESRELVRERMQAPTTLAYEHLALRGDGTIFPVEVRPRWTTMGGRRVRVAAVRDVTDRKRAETELERLIAELRARNAEMEQFTYTVSHDLKSPLVTIKGFLGMLERDIAAGDAVRTRSDLERIASAAQKMMRLLNGLLELSRIGRVGTNFARVAFGDVVKESIELLEGPLAASRVTLEIAPKLPELYGDRERLVQVVQNLVENAIKYSSKSPQPKIEIGATEHDTHVRCYVKDNGIGVEPKYAERIFGLFEKLDPKSDGTGVGLALVRRIVEFHSGRVWVESDGVAGSTFVFELPNSAVQRPESAILGVR